MKSTPIIFAFILFCAIQSNTFAQECKPELSGLFKENNYQLKHCYVLKNFFKNKNRDSWNALIIDELTTNEENQIKALRFSVWVLDKKGSLITKALNHPIFQKEYEGQGLIEFTYENQLLPVATGDFNQDGQSNIAFFLNVPPQAHFYMLGLNLDKMMVENIGYREKTPEGWQQHEWMTTGPNATVSLLQKEISIMVFDEVEIFKLKGTQYEKVP